MGLDNRPHAPEKSPSLSLAMQYGGHKAMQDILESTADGFVEHLGNFGVLIRVWLGMCGDHLQNDNCLSFLQSIFP